MTTATFLADSTQTAVDEAVAAALGSAAYDCMRVWSAWSYDTMGPDDFLPVADDSDRVREISDAAIQAVLQSPEVLRLREDAVTDIEAAAKALAKCMDYPWEHMPEQGRENMRKNALDIIRAAMEKRP